MSIRTLADDLVGQLAEERGGSSIPGGDDSFEVLADDGIVGGVDDRCELQSGFDGVASLRAFCLRQRAGRREQRGHTTSASWQLDAVSTVQSEMSWEGIGNLTCGESWMRRGGGAGGYGLGRASWGGGVG